MDRHEWLHKGERFVVTYVDEEDVDAGIDVGDTGMVVESGSPAPFVIMDGQEGRYVLYHEQIHPLPDAIAATEPVFNPQPVVAITLVEDDVLDVLTEYVREEFGIDADVVSIRNAFDGALTLVFREAA